MQTPGELNEQLELIRTFTNSLN